MLCMGSVPSAYLNKTKVRSENKQTRVGGGRLAMEET